MNMSLTEVLPEVQSLSRPDKMRLLQLLARELGEPESSIIAADQSYPVWSPNSAFDAAAEMLRALEDDRTRMAS